MLSKVESKMSVKMNCVNRISIKHINTLYISWIIKNMDILHLSVNMTP